MALPGLLYSRLPMLWRPWCRPDRGQPGLAGKETKNNEMDLFKILRKHPRMLQEKNGDDGCTKMPDRHGVKQRSGMWGGGCSSLQLEAFFDLVGSSLLSLLITHWIAGVVGAICPLSPGNLLSFIRLLKSSD